MKEEILIKWAENNGIALSAAQLKQLADYQARTLEVNRHMNLTAITDDAEFTVKHFIDSLTLLPWLPQNARVLDVGTGAGFPGLPLKIARPDIKLTLIDSLRKRIFFLRETADELNLADVECVHARAEEVIRKPEYKGRFDICAARAVARLSALAEYTVPFLKRGGLLLAMKGPDAREEIKEAAPVLKKLGAAVRETRRTEIGLGIAHQVVVVERVAK